MTKVPELTGGVSLWRQIADAIRLDIVGGRLAPGDRLPTEAMLAARFAVNRHTVRRALAVLAEDGVVVAEQGRGTFVRSIRRLSYPIGRRTRFREGLRGQASRLVSSVLDSRVDMAGAAVARSLGLRPGAKVLRIEGLAAADDVPVSRSTTWVSQQRFPEFATRLAELRSTTAVFESYGIGDYVRMSTKISARHTDADETRALRLAPGAIVLVSEAIDGEPGGAPISYALSRFPAERMELVV